MTKKQLDQIRQFCKPFYKKAGVYHDWLHILAVERNALMLAENYRDIDINILLASCYVHDIGRSMSDEGHPVESVKLAKPFLGEIGVESEEIEKISHAVICHDVSEILSAESVEARLLFDADKLEILSVYGFMRVYSWLIEERSMEMNMAVEFLWEFITTTRKEFIQTEKAKEIADHEMIVIKRVVEYFKRWNE